MIVETVTTTINPDGTVNCAAMGVEWGDETIVIKPYRATRTLRNITGLEVIGKRVKVQRGLIVEYRVDMKITFLLD